MAYDSLIAGGTLVTATGRFAADLAIDGERIAAILAPGTRVEATRVIDATGPDHERTFEIEVEVDGRVLGAGRGPSRRIAETAAALMALEALRAEVST